MRGSPRLVLPVNLGIGFSSCFPVPGSTPTSWVCRTEDDFLAVLTAVPSVPAAWHCWGRGCAQSPVGFSPSERDYRHNKAEFGAILGLLRQMPFLVFPSCHPMS